MPNSQPVTPEQVKEWQFSAVSKVLFSKLKAEYKQAQGTRPFTNGDPSKTYSDLLVVIAKEDILESLLPLFTESPEEVAEQLNERFE